MFEYFYHQILRKTVVSFGTLFNNILIRHTDANGTDVSVMKVPLAYGPTDKFLARIQQAADLNKPVQLSLPRMSFEFTGLTYDPSRKVTTTQHFKAARNLGDKTTTKKVYMPVPYNMRFELAIMAKKNDDCLQIIEQILPYFQPAYTMTVNLISDIGEKRDIPVILDGISMRDDYDGDFNQRRVLYYTLTFTAKTYLFGPVASASGVIKKATIDYMTGIDQNQARREQRYSVTPRAVRDYNVDQTTTFTENVTKTETIIDVSSVSGLTEKSYINVDGEQMRIKKIDGTKIVVERGMDGTEAIEHGVGAYVNVVNTDDDVLIEVGDDFGFNETLSFFQDFKEYSPSQGEDI
jgi:hypothetical protein